MDIIERLNDEDMYVDAIDDAIAEIEMLRAALKLASEKIELMTGSCPQDSDGMNKFAISLLLLKSNDADILDSIEDYDVISSIEGLVNFCDYQYDILDTLDEYEQITELKEGDYHIYATGDVWFESDIEWESGMEQGYWCFSIDDFIITPSRHKEADAE